MCFFCAPLVSRHKYDSKRGKCQSCIADLGDDAEFVFTPAYIRGVLGEMLAYQEQCRFKAEVEDINRAIRYLEQHDRFTDLERIAITCKLIQHLGPARIVREHNLSCTPAAISMAAKSASRKIAVVLKPK